MKSNIAAQSTLQQRDRTPAITKIVLVAVFLLGLAIIVTGWMGMREYALSGFSSEAGYDAVYKLSGDVESAWQKSLPKADGV